MTATYQTMNWVGALAAPMEKPLLEKTDEELMELYKEGSEPAFQLLYGRYSAKVYGFIRSKTRSAETADDVFQAVFTKLHKSRESYDSKYPFAPWIFTMARNALIDQARKGARNRESAIGEGLEDFEDPKGAADPVEAPDLKVLAQAQREAIEMRYFGELSFEEIAGRMDTSQSNVRQLVSRGLRRLQKFMVKDGEKNERK